MVEYDLPNSTKASSWFRVASGHVRPLPKSGGLCCRLFVFLMHTTQRIKTMCFVLYRNTISVSVSVVVLPRILVVAWSGHHIRRFAAKSTHIRPKRQPCKIAIGQPFTHTTTHTQRSLSLLCFGVSAFLLCAFFQFVVKTPTHNTESVDLSSSFNLDQQHTGNSTPQEFENKEIGDKSLREKMKNLRNAEVCATVCLCADGCYTAHNRRVWHTPSVALRFVVACR